MIKINDQITIPGKELDIQFVRSSGPGGQHVNKVSTAVRLIFDIKSSSLPDDIKEKILNFKDHRITSEGMILIKSSKYRSQLRNKEKAKESLYMLIRKALQERKKRRRSRPTKVSKLKRLSDKKHRGSIKALRKKIDRD